MGVEESADAGGIGEAGVDKALGIAEVGGEKHVKGRAVDRSAWSAWRRPGRWLRRGCRWPGETVEDRRQNGLEIGGGGDAQRGLRCRAGRAAQREQDREEFAPISKGLDCRVICKILIHAGRLTPYRKDEDESMNDNLHQLRCFGCGGRIAGAEAQPDFRCAVMRRPV